MIDQFRRLIYKTRFHLPRSPLSKLLFRSLNPVVAAMIIGIHQAYWKRTGLCIINLVSTLYQYLRSPPTLVFFFVGERGGKWNIHMGPNPGELPVRSTTHGTSHLLCHAALLVT